MQLGGLRLHRELRVRLDAGCRMHRKGWWYSRALRLEITDGRDDERIRWNKQIDSLSLTFHHSSIIMLNNPLEFQARTFASK